MLMRRGRSTDVRALPRCGHDSARDRAVIKARQGVELITSGHLRVVDEHDRDVPRDGVTVGEITVRGNVVMEGYYNDPEATAVALRGGYFHSGDAAVVHQDAQLVRRVDRHLERRTLRQRELRSQQ